MKKLPIGIQSFEKIRTDNYYYVDKTYFINKLVDEGGGYYFLSRPRRFGKSLFLDTLRYAFLGKRELFKDLYLEDNWDWDTKYPVIKISFGAGVIKDAENLKSLIISLIRNYSEKEGITIKEELLNKQFYELIEKLSVKYAQKVVVLIDEYDKPILDRIEDREKAIEIREELKNFYSVLKDADEFLKFVFITGVSKFNKVSIFSGLNQLNDITLDAEYSTICGYTQHDLETVFFDRLEGVNLDEVRRWYNGYSWLGESVYNPFDILLYLDKGEFRPYWFETGTPTFLIKLLAEKRFNIIEAEHLEVSEKVLGSFDIDAIYPENLLFQTGYLTIKDRKVINDRAIYTLSYPNREVKISFNDYFLSYLSQDTILTEKNKNRLYYAIDENDFDKLREIFRSFFASIPFDWYRKNELAGYEGYYSSIVYSYFVASGFNVVAEDMTNAGRIDLTVLYKDRAYIIEFKVVELSSEGNALQQIKEKRYYEKYVGKVKDIYLIGVEFSKSDRNIVGFDVLTLER
ncbi:ATP-binding protein [Deferribacter autotrophicus]|uniref:ATP-binding protein n=1 Tax=Deferribacter autotrophicus TaxID=500465 RepID=A0A5A8F544_9BACT|nr:ATP-binding protein [Deferribacter autotrophicus]KAA0259107.1 ATP-binding protein [Deferribacter autotrophicus]